MNYKISERTYFILTLITYVATLATITNSLNSYIFSANHPNIIGAITFGNKSVFLSLTQYLLSNIGQLTKVFQTESTVLLNIVCSYIHIIIFSLILFFKRKQFTSKFIFYVVIVFNSLLLITNLSALNPLSDILLITTILALENYKAESKQNIILYIFLITLLIPLASASTIFAYTALILLNTKNKIRLAVTAIALAFSLYLTITKGIYIYEYHTPFVHYTIMLGMLYATSYIPAHFKKLTYSFATLTIITFIFSPIEAIFLTNDFEITGHIHDFTNHFSQALFFLPLLISRVNYFRKRSEMFLIICLGLYFVTYTVINYKYTTLFKTEAQSFFSKYNEEMQGCYLVKEVPKNYTFKVDKQNSIYYSIVFREKLQSNKAIIFSNGDTEKVKKYCSYLQRGIKTYHLDFSKIK